MRWVGDQGFDRLLDEKLAALIARCLALVRWPVSEIFSCEQYRLNPAGPPFPLAS